MTFETKVLDKILKGYSEGFVFLADEDKDVVISDLRDLKSFLQTRPTLESEHVNGFFEGMYSYVDKTLKSLDDSFADAYDDADEGCLNDFEDYESDTWDETLPFYDVLSPFNYDNTTVYSDIYRDVLTKMKDALTSEDDIDFSFPSHMLDYDELLKTDFSFLDAVEEDEELDFSGFNDFTDVTE